MGLGGISIWQLLIVLVIVVMVFGSKRIKSLGGDLGGAVRGFKKAMNDNSDTGTQFSSASPSQKQATIITGNG